MNDRYASLDNDELVGVLENHIKNILQEIKDRDLLTDKTPDASMIRLRVSQILSAGAMFLAEGSGMMERVKSVIARVNQTYFPCQCEKCIADPANDRLVLNYDYADYCTDHPSYKEVKEWCEGLSGEEVKPHVSKVKTAHKVG